MKKIYILLLVSFGLIVLCSLLSGCKTGGKWIGGGSSGIKSIIEPGHLTRLPNGTYRLEPKQQENTPAELKSVELELPEITGTRVPSKSAVIPTKIVETPSKLEPLETVSPNSKLPPLTLPPLTVKLEENDRVKKAVNVRPINNDDQAVPVKTEPSDSGQGGGGASVEVNWLELFMFYLLGIMFLFFIWILYDIYRQYRKARVNEKIKKDLKESAIKPKVNKKGKVTPKNKKRGRPKKKAS